MRVIVIKPTGQGRYAARLNGRHLCISQTPLLAAARILQSEGVPPDEPIAIRHEGVAHVAITSTVGEAANQRK